MTVKKQFQHIKIYILKLSVQLAPIWLYIKQMSLKFGRPSTPGKVLCLNVATNSILIGENSKDKILFSKKCFFVKNYPEHLVLGYQYINNLSNDIFLKLLKNSFLHLKCVLNLGVRRS